MTDEAAFIAAIKAPPDVPAALAALWPGVEFELPPAEPSVFDRVVRDDIRANFIPEFADAILEARPMTARGPFLSDATDLRAYIRGEVARRMGEELDRQFAAEEARVLNGDPTAGTPAGVIDATDPEG